MSRLIAFAAIQGGYKVVSQAEGALNKALETYSADTKVGFPNTGYFYRYIIKQHFVTPGINKLENLLHFAWRSY